MADGRHLEKSKTVTAPQQFDHLHKIWHGDAFWLSEGPKCIISNNISIAASPAVAIEMSFASTILVGPRKHLAHIADRFGRILYCVHSTQYNLLVYFLLHLLSCFTILSRFSRIIPLPFQAGCRRRRLNMAFVYLCVLILCYTNF